MGRKLKSGLTESEVGIVIRHCREYGRRKVAIEHHSKPDNVIEEYKRINGAIDEALECVEVGVRMMLLDDIAYSRGYFFSQASPFMTGETYYSRKRELVYNIAKALQLV